MKLSTPVRALTSLLVASSIQAAIAGASPSRANEPDDIEAWAHNEAAAIAPASPLLVLTDYEADTIHFIPMDSVRSDLTIDWDLVDAAMASMLELQEIEQRLTEHEAELSVDVTGSTWAAGNLLAQDGYEDR